MFVGEKCTFCWTEKHVLLAAVQPSPTDQLCVCVMHPIVPINENTLISSCRQNTVCLVIRKTLVGGAVAHLGLRPAGHYPVQ